MACVCRASPDVHSHFSAKRLQALLNFFRSQGLTGSALSQRQFEGEDGLVESAANEKAEHCISVVPCLHAEGSLQDNTPYTVDSMLLLHW